MVLTVGRLLAHYSVHDRRQVGWMRCITVLSSFGVGRFAALQAET